MPHALDADPGGPLASPSDSEGQSRTLHLVCFGALTPQTAAADLLNCLIAWVEEQPWRAATLAWFGEGNLRGLLAAQPLPATLSQQFRGNLPLSALLPVVAAADLLCITDRAPLGAPVITAMHDSRAMILGNRQSGDARTLLADGKAGWLFDASRPASLFAALGAALARCQVPAANALGGEISMARA